MKILVFGLGALGTVYSCLLKNAGHTVDGIDYPAVIAKIAQQGVKITGIWGEKQTRLDTVASSISELQDSRYDLLIVTVKAYETAEVARQLQGVLSPNTCVFLAQNGYGNYEAAAKYIPEKQIILGRVIFGAETVEPGLSRVTVIADDVVLGSPMGLIGFELLQELADMFSAAGIPTRASKEIMKYLWGKIIYNCALNPLGAILEVPYGKLGETEAGQHIMNGIVKEIFAVLSALNQATMWKNADAYLHDFYTLLLPSTASHHASMLQDIQRGRKTEIDALNGAVVKLGEQYGVNTPVNNIVTSILKAKEAMLL